MKTFVAYAFVVAVLQTAVKTAEAAKILLLPTMAKSHALELLHIGEELARRGYQVSFYLPSSIDSKIPKQSPVGVITYTIPDEYKTMFENSMDNIQSGDWKINGHVFDIFFDIRNITKAMCLGLFSDRKQLGYLVKERFDLAIVTTLPFTQCLFSLPYYLNISTVASSAYIVETHSSAPFQSNTLPVSLSSFGNDMNFFERCVNSVQSIVSPILLSYFVTPDMSVIDPVFANIDVNQLVKQAVLYLENSDYVFDYPKAVFPNFVHVGGLTATPAKKLDKKLEDFMARSPEGIIFVSFGSLVPIQFAPKTMVENMLAALRQSGFNVLLKSDSDHDDGNIRFSKWLPQNDILGHPKTKLFISHCGKNGLFESIYHGVPILCMPRSIDQPMNSRRVSRMAIGIHLDFNKASSAEMSSAIHDCIHNETFRENMKKLSVMFRDRRETPVQRAANAVEYVLKYGKVYLHKLISTQ
ncbi:UDP-glucuronosyltransferase 2B4-like [Gigantopelta aegis]|uniref:UDP-glucuronosyltransferase 2B4-like n=1 Tax=Gigantopelta aegis TaxID=1735272 RepID=UPI001B88AB79|nr:UDP-glucuronosyltransferase 2B4-like [Gigantopelta aegis]